MVDVVLSAALGRVGNPLAGLAFGADEKHPAAAGDDLAHEAERLVQQRHRLLEVDDMDAIALPEEIGGHARVPASRGVSEVNASLKQLAHRKGR